MTWVVGVSSLFGYGVMVSDVRISWNDGTEADLLRKSYQVGPYILAGFAGSVDVGLRLIGSLQQFLDVPDMPSDVAWQPEWVAENWAPLAAKLFAESPEVQRQSGSQILMVGVSPDQNMGTPIVPRVYVVKFNWPDFTPVYSPPGLSVCHIGSGSDIEPFEKAMSEFFSISSSALQAEVASPTAWADIIGSSVGRLVAENPVKGISPHVHIQICRLGRFYSGSNDENTYYPDGRRVEFRMPQVASTYGEFVVMCKQIGKGAATAVA